ncbi:secondary thiamine-phosphate synthase enzyme YjbQ [Alteromonas facilis]|uniref:secondary thiamine-phosphate synthase enzyme YjbQ n=1 Tax=Alteromonas facilis TaxID=2048004 RepID=UPI000C28696C|nr:secondary thiamine-phosphate synthase enzyme YjbQ [Alteromonas facilis]
MEWHSKKIVLPEYARGFHLITHTITDELPEIRYFSHAIVHLSLLHTSASLTINENADPSVRQDMNAFFNNIVSEDTPYFTHTYEGPDDMPAHVKSSLLGTQLSIAVENGQLVLGTWQGIYLGEHRDHGGRRSIHITVMGKPK